MTESLRRRDALDASLQALLPQVRLTLTQIRLTPEAAPALRRLGMDLGVQERLLQGLYAESEAALVRRAVARALLDRSWAEAAAAAEATLEWARDCRTALRGDPARVLLTLEVPRFAGAWACLEAAVPAVVVSPELSAEGTRLLERARVLAAELEEHSGTHALAAREVERLRVAVRSALRALRRVWDQAPGLATLNLSHAARSVQ